MARPIDWQIATVSAVRDLMLGLPAASDVLKSVVWLLAILVVFVPLVGAGILMFSRHSTNSPISRSSTNALTPSPAVQTSIVAGP